MSAPSGDALADVAAEIRGCTRCRLAATRTHAVPGSGDPAAPLVLVGEAPGAREDRTGLPFQGTSGRFLDRALAAAGTTRERVWIAAVNRCRPPRNRVPRRDEQAACRGYLEREVALVAPRVVLAMGATAAGALHPAATPDVRVGDLRAAPVGLEAGGIGASIPAELRVTYHPASAMRFPARREPFLADLAAAVAAAGLGRPGTMH